MQTVAWLEALGRGRPSPRWAGRAVLAVTGVVVVAVFSLAIALSETGPVLLVLLAVPVTLLAVSFGRWAGLAAALAVLGLTAIYDVRSSGDVGGPFGYAAGAVAVVLLGFPLGWFVDRLVAARETQERTRRELQRARDELEEAQRVAGVGSWLWDAATDRLTWSAEMQRLFAVGPGGPRTFEEFATNRLHPDDVAATVEARDRALRDRQPFEFHQRLVLPDGRTRQVLVRGEVVVENDVVTGMRGTTQDITALYEAELAAEAARERLASALETLVDAVVVSTAVRDGGEIVDFRVEYANPSAVRVLGYPTDQLVGRRWSEVWPHRMGTELFAAYVRLVETGEPLVVTEAQNLDFAPGLAEILDLRAARLGDGCVTIARDVTARVHADRALAEATAQFTAAFDRAPVGMALIRPDGVLMRANEALGTITGHAPSALTGAPLPSLVHPHDTESSQALLDALFRGSAVTTRRDELRLRTVAGDPRWVCLSMALVGTGETAYAVAHLEDIHDRKLVEGRMQYLADHDALTGLYNRRRFHEELDHHHALATRYGGGGVVALIDLDNFKYINDTLGHRAGDELIQAIGRMLRSRLRDSDVIGRLGGDEFAVLLPGADVDRAVDVTESLLAGIRSTEIDEAGQRVRSTGSAGLARIDEVDIAGADAVLAKADLAMYAAKDAGRDTLVVHDPRSPHVARSRARFRWLDRVRQALDNDLFVLRAQPILELSSGAVTGCELLVRMRHGDQLIEPDRFLHIAERHGMAAAIDRVVVARSIDLIAEQPRPPGFRWEINLSADSLGDPALPRLIEAKLMETGIPPAALVFEITETAAITKMDEARAFAARISDLGCGFALDDFGAGYGSFYYLKHLPFDYLKIDGEFVRQLATSDVDQTIVRAIVAAAHPLGKQTIAEYVGNAATLDVLRELGVDHAQGYFIGAPVDPELPLFTSAASPRVGSDP